MGNAEGLFLVSSSQLKDTNGLPYRVGLTGQDRLANKLDGIADTKPPRPQLVLVVVVIEFAQQISARLLDC